LEIILSNCTINGNIIRIYSNKNIYTFEKLIVIFFFGWNIQEFLKRGYMVFKELLMEVFTSTSTTNGSI